MAQFLESNESVMRKAGRVIKVRSANMPREIEEECIEIKISDCGLMRNVTDIDLHISSCVVTEVAIIQGSNAATATCYSWR
eukprot:753837-Hanusia_phi.AAC.5